MRVERILLYCKFSRRYQGYAQLRECVRIALEEEDKLTYISGIYYEVGKKYHVSASCVERNIRTVITYVWGHGGKAPLEEISGGKLYQRPTAGEVIDIMVCYLKDHGEEIL